MKPQIVAAQQAEETEQQLVERATAVLSQCNWEVGRCASKFSKLRGTDADFGARIGLSEDQVRQRRAVWERWNGKPDTYPVLKWSHFYVALNWEDAADCLKWASDMEASVAEMKSWRRANRGEDLGTTEDAEGSGDGQVVPGDGRPVSQLESPQAATQKVRRTDRNETGRNSPGGAAERQASSPSANCRPETAPTASRESRPVSEDETADAQNALQGITEACGTLLVALKDIAAKKQAASVLRQTADALDPSGVVGSVQWTELDGGRIRLGLGDCLEALPEIEPGSVDCVVTSPPYNQLGSRMPANPSGMHAKTQWVSNTRAVGYADDMEESEYQQWLSRVLAGCAESCRGGGSIFVNHKCRWRDTVLLHPIQWMRFDGGRLRQEIIWRRGGSTTLNARMFAPNEERILWFITGAGRWKWNQPSASFLSVWDISPDCDPNGHPCPYPLEIPTRCIAATTDSDDVVLDPFLGSGTSGEAAIRLGRRFIGLEKEPRFFEMSLHRIQSALGMEVPGKDGSVQKRLWDMTTGAEK